MLILIGDLDLPAFHACAALLERTVPRCAARDARRTPITSACSSRRVRRPPPSKGTSGSTTGRPCSRPDDRAMTYYPLVNLGDGLAGRISAGRGEGVLWIHRLRARLQLLERALGPAPRLATRRLSTCPATANPCRCPRAKTCPRWRGRLRHSRARARGAATSWAFRLEPRWPCRWPSRRPARSPRSSWDRPCRNRARRVSPSGCGIASWSTMYRMAGHGAHLRGRLMLVEPSPFEGVAARPDLWPRLWDIVDATVSGTSGTPRSSSRQQPRAARVPAPHRVVRPAGRGRAGACGGSRSRREARQSVAELPVDTSCSGRAAIRCSRAPESVAAAIAAHVRAGAGRMAPQLAPGRWRMSEIDRRSLHSLLRERRPLAQR